MDSSTVEMGARVSPASLLGYLNFSDGRPDPKFQANAAAAGAILLAMTLLMNAVAIWVRYRFRKKINW
jgi:ABC-type phosphate transport system permease subunit